VFLSNQFWKHKNHLLVVEALRLLKARSRPTAVAVTRMQSDPRNPRHFVAVEAAIARAGMQQEFLLLGVLPHRHLGPLACGSLALGNSFHAKGSSTRVEEAQALGIPVPLSDLALYGEHVGGRYDVLRPLRNVSRHVSEIAPYRSRRARSLWPTVHGRSALAHSALCCRVRRSRAAY
jgi:hypothetical protein